MSLENLLTAAQIAKQLDLDVQTIYRNAQKLGGVKFARKWFFDENIVRRRLFGDVKEASCAIQKEEKRQDNRLESAGQKKRDPQKPRLFHQGRSQRAGSTVDTGDRQTNDNPHGLGVGDGLFGL